MICLLFFFRLWKKLLKLIMFYFKEGNLLNRGIIVQFSCILHCHLTKIQFHNLTPDNFYQWCPLLFEFHVFQKLNKHPITFYIIRAYQNNLWVLKWADFQVMELHCRNHLSVEESMDHFSALLLMLNKLNIISLALFQSNFFFLQKRLLLQHFK